MTEDIFSEKALDRLAEAMNAHISKQVEEERTAELKWIRPRNTPIRMPKKDVETVEAAVKECGQKPETFWGFFKDAAYNDICGEKGALHRQFQTYGDLSNKTVAAQFGAILTAAGLSGNALEVALVVLGANFLRLTVDALCGSWKQAREENAE
ncbi:MAG: hypothetical protein ACLFTV_13480 [Desulfococcaceae bacterium]